MSDLSQSVRLSVTSLAAGNPERGNERLLDQVGYTEGKPAESFSSALIKIPAQILMRCAQVEVLRRYPSRRKRIAALYSHSDTRSLTF